MIDLIFIPVFISYLIFTLKLYFSWRSIPYFIPAEKERAGEQLFVSVVIAVRNEAENILHLMKDLEQQTFPADRFEVIVVDDCSQDATVGTVDEYMQKSKMTIKLLHASYNRKVSSPKKNALTTGIKVASGDLIITTDGDCRVGVEWLDTLEAAMREKDAAMVFGPVTFHQERSLFERIQTIEFASLTGAGAATLQMQIPTMCNAANLGFRKQVFEDVEGYKGNEDVASGDDEFLMHKVFRHFSGKVFFLKSEKSKVTTYAKSNWSDFFSQRKRWASKWSRYEVAGPKWIAFLIFMVNFLTIVGLGAVIFNYLTAYLFLSFLLLKIIFEFVFLREILIFLGKKISIRDFMILELLYPSYVSFFGIISKIGKYEWKGRRWN